MPKTSNKKPRSTSETTEDVVEDIFRTSLEQIRDEITALKSKKTKPKKGFTATEAIAYLAKQASVFAAEQRKAESARNKRLDALTSAMVVEWFRALPSSERQLLLRELEHLTTTKRSGLA